jgi:hypothetical protein
LLIQNFREAEETNPAALQQSPALIPVPSDVVLDKNIDLQRCVWVPDVRNAVGVNQAWAMLSGQMARSEEFEPPQEIKPIRKTPPKKMLGSSSGRIGFCVLS